MKDVKNKPLRLKPKKDASPFRIIGAIIATYLAVWATIIAGIAYAVVWVAGKL